MIVKVIWNDAFHECGWGEVADVADRMIIHSVGFLVERRKGSIVLAMSSDDDGGYGDFLSIPKPWIISEIQLKE